MCYYYFGYFSLNQLIIFPGLSGLVNHLFVLPVYLSPRACLCKKDNTVLSSVSDTHSKVLLLHQGGY